MWTGSCQYIILNWRRWGRFYYLPDCGVMSVCQPPMSGCHNVRVTRTRVTTDISSSISAAKHGINQHWLEILLVCPPLSLLNPPPRRSVRWSVTWCPLCVPYHWGRARAIYWKLLECNKRNISGPSSLYSKIEINWLFASGVEHILGTTALRVEICKIRKQPSV